jgi:hypothetical protein
MMMRLHGTVGSHSLGTAYRAHCPAVLSSAAAMLMMPTTQQIVALALATSVATQRVAAGPAQPAGSCSYNPQNFTTTCDKQFEQIAPPASSDKADWSAWMAELHGWREQARVNSSWPSKWYDEEGLAWARTSFLQRASLPATHSLP